MNPETDTTIAVAAHLTRRRFLGLVGAGAAGVALGACGGSGSGGPPTGGARGSGATTTSARPAGDAAPSPIDWEPVTRRLQDAVDTGAVPGAGLIVRQGGATLYEHAVGNQAVDTPLLIASATKLASTTVLMSLVDERLVDLDTRIARYLPEFDDAKGDVTVRQLLNQTHGLPFDHPSIPAPQQDNGITLAESVRQIASGLELEFAPGSRFSYQPAVSYHIAGRIAEVVTGTAWNELFHERAAGPLRMGATTYGETANPRIGGGAVTMLRDYANLLELHFDDGMFEGRRVLSAESVREMRRNQVGDLEVTGSRQKPEVGYGLTWWFDAVDGGEPVQFSVSGAFGAIPWLNVKHGYVAFLLVQKRLADAVAIYDEVLPLIDGLARG